MYLWWDCSSAKGMSCIYGEIRVLETHFPMYYCGANWQPGHPAGGYCGIQHNCDTERRTIFSVWDTEVGVKPTVTRAHQNTIYNRFVNEGKGAHTHMLWNWELDSTFRFFVRKTPVALLNTTEVKYYVFDNVLSKWIHSATISTPNGSAASYRSVLTFGNNGLGSFIENFRGIEHDVPKLALYQLWIGNHFSDMQYLRMAREGNGTDWEHWGQLNGMFFLAEGEKRRLDAVFERLKPKFGSPVIGLKGSQLPPVPDCQMREEAQCLWEQSITDSPNVS